MKKAGFIDIELVNRNSWYANEAEKELQWLKGPNRAKLQERHGQEFIDHQVEIWSKLVTVLKIGEHCPHHIRARKPL
jgi:phosphoethanolamine N-methyltransferase